MHRLRASSLADVDSSPQAASILFSGVASCEVDRSRKRDEQIWGPRVWEFTLEEDLRDGSVTRETRRV
jgi:hypothetical protein